WKGILLSGGSLTLTTSSIQKGGKSTFAGQTETAAITVTGGTLTLTGGNTVTASTGYDILITSMSTSSTIFANSLSALKPIKAPIANLSSIGTNSYNAGNYDYIVLTTPGAGTTVGSGTGNFTFLSNT